METRSSDHRRHALGRVLATAGVAGAAVALAAMPALAAPPGSHSHSHDSTASKPHSGHSGSSSRAHSSSSQSTSSHSSQSPSDGAGGHGAPATSSDTSGHNPPGNNGTVFIHDVAGDHSPHNVPHVSCTFYVDFFGFDNGQVVTVSFAGQAPTGKDVALGGTWTGVVSDDDASGAGNDFDKELAYTADDLGVTSLGAPAAQGYHVKMTVATNEPGGKKSKVFWISPCATVVGGTTGAGSVAGPTGGVLGTTLGSATGAASTSRPAGTTVLGEKFTRPAAVAGSSTGLPFTGADIWRMVAAGLAALVAGAAVAASGRRRRIQ